MQPNIWGNHVLAAEGGVAWFDDSFPDFIYSLGEFVLKTIYGIMFN